MIRRDYCMHLSTKEGQVVVQVGVEDSGEIKLEISTAEDEDNNTVLTFKSDSDVKGLIEILRWSRVRSLEAQGFKVVV